MVQLSKFIFERFDHYYIAEAQGSVHRKLLTDMSAEMKRAFARDIEFA